MANLSGSLTSANGIATITASPNDTLTVTPTSGSFTLEYPLGTVLASGISITTTYALTAGGQARLMCITGSVAYLLTDNPDGYTLTQAQVVATQTLVSRLPSIPSLKAGSVSAAYTGGATPWVQIAGPNDLRLNWTASAELATAFSYVTAQSAANGPAMFRREGASIMFDFSKATQLYGNFRNLAAGLSAATLKNTTIAVVMYVHRLQANMSVRLRIGTDTANWIYYNFQNSAAMLIEGWNTLLVHTGEAIGAGNAPNGQLSFQGNVPDAWVVGAGSFDPATNNATINYVAVEFVGFGPAIGNSRTFAWLEGVYVGGKDKPKLTIGFDIQTNGLDLAKTIMDKYGLVGYAAVPTGNGVPANPSYVWLAPDVGRLQALYASGWDIIQHSVSHNSMGAYADEAMLIAEIETTRAQIISIGCPAGADLFATPNGSYSNRLVSLASKAKILWMRHVINAPMLIPRGLGGMANPLIQGAASFANEANAVKTLAYVDLMIQYGASGHIYSHAILVGGSGINTDSVVFEAICAGIKARVDAGLIEVVTPSAFVRESAAPGNDSFLANPSRLSLVAGTSPFDLFNTGYKPLRFVISGGTVSAITFSRDGTNFDSTSVVAGTFDVNPGDRLRITYTVAPTIIQYSI